MYLFLDYGVNVANTVTEQRSLLNMDRYSLIWFDIDTPFERNTRIQANLKSIINDLFVLRDLTRVEGQLQSLKDQKVFLIFNGNVGKQLAERIHRRTQVAATYVYCKKPHLHDHLRPLFPKVGIISFFDDNEFSMLVLIETLRK